MKAFIFVVAVAVTCFTINKGISSYVSSAQTHKAAVETAMLQLKN